MILHSFQRDALEILSRPEINLALTSPTGSGKGVVLERLAVDPGERILVLSPLVALARQQRTRFKTAGIPDERVRILSPESALLRERAIREWRPTLIAVDEAHCLPEWGDRFRPAYGKLLEFIRASGCPRTLWMSATFPRTLANELREKLPGEWETLGRYRMPATLTVRTHRTPPTDRVEIVRAAVLGEPEPGLLFTGTRRDVGKYLELVSAIRPALPYHAGLADEERRLVEAALLRESREDRARTSVVATNAFGMGMDFPQFRWATLAQTPFSLLALMQAFGRVGRGNRPGLANLYWADEDFRFAGLLLGLENKDAHRNLAVLRNYIEGTDSDRRAIEAEEFL